MIIRSFYELGACFCPFRLFCLFLYAVFLFFFLIIPFRCVFLLQITSDLIERTWTLRLFVIGTNFALTVSSTKCTSRVYDRSKRFDFPTYHVWGGGLSQEHWFFIRFLWIIPFIRGHLTVFSLVGLVNSNGIHSIRDLNLPSHVQRRVFSLVLSWLLSSLFTEVHTELQTQCTRGRCLSTPFSVVQSGISSWSHTSLVHNNISCYTCLVSRVFTWLFRHIYHHAISI